MLTEESKRKLLKNMTENLQMLRVKIGLTQGELAERLGVGRHTITNIENKKRDMTWNNYMALLLLFTKNAETNKLLNVLEIYTDEINDFLNDSEKKNESEEKSQINTNKKEMQQ